MTGVACGDVEANGLPADEPRLLVDEDQELHSLPFHGMERQVMQATGILRKILSWTPIPRVALHSLSGVGVVLYHDIGNPNEFTDGMGVVTAADVFERHMEILSKHYNFVSISDIVAGNLPDRPLLVTFDDAYKSVLDTASPITQRFGAKPLFFISTAPVFDGRIILDNLLTFAQNNAPEELRAIFGTPLGTTAATILSSVLPSRSAGERREFRDRLAASLGATPQEWGRRSGLYLDQDDLLELRGRGFDLGTHTSSHIHLRGLLPSEHDEELRGPSLLIEKLTGEKPVSFSLPFGSRGDLMSLAMESLRSVGIRKTFLVEGMRNARESGEVMCRNSVGKMDAGQLLAEIEVVSRLKRRTIQELP